MSEQAKSCLSPSSPVPLTREKPTQNLTLDLTVKLGKTSTSLSRMEGLLVHAWGPSTPVGCREVVFQGWSGLSPPSPPQILSSTWLFILPGRWASGTLAEITGSRCAPWNLFTGDL